MLHVNIKLEREHAIEMGHNPDREEPFFFQKPADSAICTQTVKGGIIPYPSQTKDLHHEAELVVALKHGGINLTLEESKSCIYGYALGCDLTRRDLQSLAKDMRRPWDAAKGFDYGAPCGPILPLDSNGSPSLLADTYIECRVNSKLRQQAKCPECMIWSIPEIISILSKYYRLQSGDLIMTGTPAGVSSLQIGDSVEISCGDIPKCSFEVGANEQ